MDSGASELDGHHGVQEADRRLEGLEVRILVREDAEHPSIDAEADAGVYVLFRRLEPRIALRLEQRRQSAYRAQARRTQGTATYLLEDVV